MTRPPRQPLRDPSRRELLAGLGCAAALPLLGLAPAARALNGSGGAPAAVPAPAGGRLALPPRVPRARALIFLFMYGGPSQVDTFDEKPELSRLDGQTIPVETRGRGGERDTGRVVGSPWSFRSRGRCGHRVSELFPHVGGCVDEIAFVHSMVADSPIHGSAMLMMNTGSLQSGHPALGAWIDYALGTRNGDLPGFVVLLDPRGGPISGARNWSSGYMPARHQGVVLRSSGTPILDLAVPPDGSRSRLRRLLDALVERNDLHQQGRANVDELSARTASYELAWRMLDSAPEALDVAAEPEATRALYGLHDPATADFGRRCLLVRRLVERGVRCVQLYSGGGHDDDTWDAHGDLRKNHELHARATDRPIAALLTDLKRTGLLDETLVVWGGEFGRQPVAEYESGTGRDHSSAGFTVWLAGGGIPGGTAVGATDELGSAAVVDPHHVHALHATILHQLGLDANALSYRHEGLDKRLVGVEGALPIAGLV